MPAFCFPPLLILIGKAGLVPREHGVSMVMACLEMSFWKQVLCVCVCVWETEKETIDAPQGSYQLESAEVLHRGGVGKLGWNKGHDVHACALQGSFYKTQAYLCPSCCIHTACIEINANFYYRIIFYKHK